MEAIIVLRQIIAETTEEDLTQTTTATLMADLGIKRHSNEELAVLKGVVDNLSTMFAIMPTNIQSSFVEMSS